ncbi:MAG: hypothetical protein ACFB10_04410 [Salibacteraceae bacterium]
MKHIALLFTIALLTLSSTVLAQSAADKIVGTWDAGEGKVEIQKVDGRYIGYPIKSDGTKVTARELLNVVYQEGQWKGKIYSKKKAEYFDVVCELEGEKLLLEVSAGWLSKDLEWTRVN